MFLQYYHINLEEPKYAIIKQQLENDYYTICSLLNNHINASGYIHTSNGQYIQIRSKDKKPYTPIFSSTYDKNISNKNHAFYFKKDFINYIKSV